MAGLGTLINVVAIVAGTAAGLIAGGRIPARTRTTVLQGVGLVTAVIGIGQALTTENIVFPLVALVVGALVGEAVGVEERLESLGERVRRRVEARADPMVEGTPAETTTDADRPADHAKGSPVDGPRRRSSFVEGFVAASLLFGIGPMAILGSIQDGLGRGVELLVVKAALDGLVSIVFASTLGWGVGFSVLPVGLYQAALTAGAGAADAVLEARMVTEMTATGGLIIVGIALRLLDLKEVRVASFLPALLVAPALVAVFA